MAKISASAAIAKIGTTTIEATPIEASKSVTTQETSSSTVVTEVSKPIPTMEASISAMIVLLVLAMIDTKCFFNSRYFQSSSYEY